jgi:hypothetical protein
VPSVIARSECDEAIPRSMRIDGQIASSQGSSR